MEFMAEQLTWVQLTEKRLNAVIEWHNKQFAADLEKAREER